MLFAGEFDEAVVLVQNVGQVALPLADVPH